MDHALRILKLKFFLSAILLFMMSQATVAQGCFGKCLDHLSQPLRGNEDLKARFEKSDQILKGLIGCKAPDFDVTTITGERIKLAELKENLLKQRGVRVRDALEEINKRDLPIPRKASQTATPPYL